ncbi:MAG: hypothetical protein R3C28_09875 [Pirellulaceae bacterium]
MKLDDFKVDVQANVFIEGGSNQKDEFRRTTRVLGRLVREDRWGKDGRRRVRSFTGDDYIFWEEDTIPMIEGMAIHRWPISNEPDIAREPSDPRLYGLACGITAILTIHESVKQEMNVIQTKDRHDLSFTSEPGRVKGEWTNQHGARISVTLGEEPKPHVCRIQASSNGYTSSLDVTPQFLPELAFGYPQKLVFKQITPDSRLDISEEAVVKLSLKQSLRPETFQLAGLEIPRKKIVQMERGPQSPQYWDGKQVRSGYVETSQRRSKTPAGRKASDESP